jgi:hypothetical protein
MYLLILDSFLIAGGAAWYNDDIYLAVPWSRDYLLCWSTHFLTSLRVTLGVSTKCTEVVNDKFYMSNKF